jgi:hypothetical protein
MSNLLEMPGIGNICSPETAIQVGQISIISCDVYIPDDETNIVKSDLKRLS